MSRKIELDQEHETESEYENDDFEFEGEEQEDEEDDEQESPRRSKEAARLAELEAENKRLKAAQSQRPAQAPQQPQGTKLSASDKVVAEMEAEGFNKEQIKAIKKLVDAKEADIEEKYAADQGQQQIAQLDRACWNTMASAFEDIIKDHPEAAWIKDTIMQRTVADVRNSESAKEKYNRLEVPVKEIREALKANLQTWQKETGRTKTNGGSRNLDLRSSKANPSRSNSSSSFDKSRMTAVERKIYMITLDNTGDEEIAIRAVKRLAKTGIVTE